MEQLRLVTAEPHHALQLSRLAETTFRQTFDSHNDPTDMEIYLRSSFSEDKQRDELVDPTRRTRLAFIGDDLIAYTQMRLGRSWKKVDDPTSVELIRLYVDRAWHGRGVAQDLMRDALQFATDANFQTIWLGVWEENHRAQAFYRKWNFVEVGSHTFMIGNDSQRDLLLARSASFSPRD